MVWFLLLESEIYNLQILVLCLPFQGVKCLSIPKRNLQKQIFVWWKHLNFYSLPSFVHHIESLLFIKGKAITKSMFSLFFVVVFLTFCFREVIRGTGRCPGRPQRVPKAKKWGRIYVLGVFSSNIDQICDYSKLFYGRFRILGGSLGNFTATMWGGGEELNIGRNNCTWKFLPRGK